MPGAGLDATGNYRQVKSAQFLVVAAALKAAYRKRFRELMQQHGWQCDPAVWRKPWAVNVQAFGNGTNAIKYLGAYVGRSVIGDRRIVSISPTHVTFRWKDRTHGGIERISKIEGIEFDLVASSGSFTLPLRSRAVRSSQSDSRLPPPLG